MLESNREFNQKERIKMPIKDDLIGDQFVNGNSKTFLQQYNLLYYHPEINYPTPKVWLYLQGKQFNEQKNQYEQRHIKSLCFNNIENHRNFIVNNILYHIHWLIQIGNEFRPDWMTLEEYKIKMTDAVLLDIRIKLRNKLEQLNFNAPLRET